MRKSQDIFSRLFPADRNPHFLLRHKPYYGKMKETLIQGKYRRHPTSAVFHAFPAISVIQKKRRNLI